MISNPDDKIHVFIKYIKDCKVYSMDQFWCKPGDRLPQQGDMIGLACGSSNKKDIYRVTEIIWSDNWKTMHVQAKYDLRTFEPESTESKPAKKAVTVKDSNTIYATMRFMVNHSVCHSTTIKVNRLDMPRVGDAYDIEPLLGYTKFLVKHVMWTNDEHTMCIVNLEAIVK